MDVMGTFSLRAGMKRKRPAVANVRFDPKLVLTPDTNKANRFRL